MKIQLSIVIFIFCINNITLVSFVSSQSMERRFLDLDDPCYMNNVYGTCKKIVDCEPILEEARQGRRSANSPRCGYDGFTEIVCCPLKVKEKLGIRPAESACQQYENEIFSSPDLELLNFHILGGTEASAGEFPFMAALGYMIVDDVNKTRIKYYCGGTIISEHFILTAAHCVRNVDNRLPVLVRLGSLLLDTDDDNAQEIRISNITAHPNYKFSQVYDDIALLKLSKSIKWTQTVKPICLPTKSLESVNVTNSNVSLIVAGWGATDIGEDASYKLMKSPSLEIVNRSDCGIHYRNFRQVSHGIHDSMICAKDANTTRHSDTCQGDSGGPFIMRVLADDTLIGITSFGQSCGGPSPGVYTSVHAYLDWIESHVWRESGRH